MCFYYRGNLAYESNYGAGLRILDITNIKDDDPQLEEVAFFDLAPGQSGPDFFGVWSSYVYFESGTIISQSIERGLFVLEYTGSKWEEIIRWTKLQSIPSQL